VYYVIVWFDQNKSAFGAQPATPSVISAAWTLTQTSSVAPAGAKYVALYGEVDHAGTATTARFDDAFIQINGNRLYRVTLPQGYATNFAYDALLRLQTITDPAGGPWDYTYDGLNGIATSLAPTIQDYTGAALRPTTTFVTPERVVWQP